MYDGTIGFTVDDSSSAIAEASLDFQPVYPNIQQIGNEAIPREATRSYSFTGTTRSENFIQDVVGLKGGKEYVAAARARDQASNESESQLSIPYVKEFENISSQAKLEVSVHYGPFMNPDLWRWRSAQDKEITNPLLGWYQSGDTFVTSKHIDWLGGFGISCLTIIWFGSSLFEPSIKQILAHASLRDLRFFVWYDLTTHLQNTVGPKDYFGPWSADDPAVSKILSESLGFWIRNYFNHPSYLKINGACPVYYSAVSGLLGDVGSMMKQLRKTASEAGIDLFTISDSVHYVEPKLSKVVPFDAITQFANHSFVDPKINANVETYMDGTYASWSSLAKNNGVHFVPTVSPGYKNLYFNDWLVSTRGIQGFKNRLEICKRYLDADVRLLFVTTFNDWMENTHIEPSLEEGFQYLQAIKEFAAG